METENITKEYELAFVLRNEAGVDAVLSALRAHGAVLAFQSPVNTLTLSYPIKKVTSAFFGYVTFASAPENMIAINHDLKTSNDVLRHLVVTPPIGKRTQRLMASSPARKPFGVRPSSSDAKPATAQPLSNEALEKKLEEIMQ